MFALIHKKRSGFTLVEMMVVITIIGILMAVVFSSLSVARKKSRVAKRVTDIKQVQAALEFYYSTNHSYPSTSSAWRGTCSSFGSYSANNVIPGLAPMFINAVPTDPQSGTTADTCYLYYSNGVDYVFLVHWVPEMMASDLPNYSSYPELFDASRPTWAWKVSSPGGVNW